MKLILSDAEAGPRDMPLAGGKALALSALSRYGFQVPGFVCVTTDAYNAFVDRTGLRERIQLELNRKDFKDMRWEEVWDCATRIRNLFLRKPMPPDLESALRDGIEERFGSAPVAVRSSATDEDGAASSFAGLHESYVHVRGAAATLEHTRMVWASLWSDAALLYRQELGLDVGRSAMAVVVQEMIIGERSGVAFSQSPNDPSQAVVEAVYGLNQGLVDGAVEPDRWVVDRDYGRILSHTPAPRSHRLSATEKGVETLPLPPETAAKPPLAEDEVQAVVALSRKAEAHFGVPQDVEWTLREGRFYLLQSRAVTTRPQAAEGDQRVWYLSLHRSLDNLKALREKIEAETVPAMIRAAEELAAIDPAALSDRALAAEIRRRVDINAAWVNVYWADFIPFAHAIRLFGQAYNDAVRPEDPYEFVDLLTRTGMASLERNRLLEELAERVRVDPGTAACLAQGDCGEKRPEFRRALEDFIARFGDLSCEVTGGTQCEGATRPLTRILLQMATRPTNRPAAVPRADTDADAPARRFLDALPDSRRREARELLELARVSYRLRDDDNILLGRIEAQLVAAVNEGRRRLDTALPPGEGREALRAAVAETAPGSHPVKDPEITPAGPLRPRQLIGQPAGQGVARGAARVIRRHADLAEFAHGEILVCDAVDPNMTYVVPLAAAVVERRGGMLIHGAIIAREYGLPCVTGIADAAALIRSGDLLTVDGYLGIVTIGSGDL